MLIAAMLSRDRHSLINDMIFIQCNKLKAHEHTLNKISNWLNF